MVHRRIESNITIDKAYVESLKNLAFFLEGMKAANSGALQPLGAITTDALWLAIKIIQTAPNIKIK